MNLARQSIGRLAVWNAVIALSLGHAAANGETFKCIDPAGKAIYQAVPCPPPVDETRKFQAPGPTGSSAPAGAAMGFSRAPKDRMPSEADFRGPRETWDRLTQAMIRGDREAALKELTPSAQRRLAATLDAIGGKSTPPTLDEIGSIRSVMLAGEGLATIKLTRKKSDGTYAHDVMLIRDADGKWRIDNM